MQKRLKTPELTEIKIKVSSGVPEKFCGVLHLARVP